MFTKLNEDPRTAAAREYLADATYARPVTTLPPTVLMRELAETRRQLGIMLAVLDGLALTEALRGTIGQALADAVSYRTDGASRRGWAAPGSRGRWSPSPHRGTALARRAAGL